MSETKTKESPVALKMRAVLEEAAGPICNAFCPSKWRTAEGQVHGELCTKVRDALASKDSTP